jgi:hypothetical protein
MLAGSKFGYRGDVRWCRAGLSQSGMLLEPALTGAETIVKEKKAGSELTFVEIR